MKPILFNTEMVRAILEGRKTVTRRVVKFKDGKNPNWTGYVKDGLTLYNGTNEPCSLPAPYQVNDILYVRETWQSWSCAECDCECVPDNGNGCCDMPKYLYKASHETPDKGWKPSIHMPKEAARLFLRVTSVKVERLQDMKKDDCEREGLEDFCKRCGELFGTCDGCMNEGGIIEDFKDLWNSTVKKDQIDTYGWNANPYVWVIEFEDISEDIKNGRV